MKQYWILCALGVFIFFLPFLGFPSAWKTVFLFIAGLAVSALSLSCIIKSRAENRGETSDNEHGTDHAK